MRHLLVWLVLGATACGQTESAYDACLDDPSSGCCSHAECADDEICDFDYRCRQDFFGGYHCDEPTGDRQCHLTCATDGTCADGGECVELEMTQGRGPAELFYACF